MSEEPDNYLIWIEYLRASGLNGSCTSLQTIRVSSVRSIWWRSQDIPPPLSANENSPVLSFGHHFALYAYIIYTISRDVLIVLPYTLCCVLNLRSYRQRHAIIAERNVLLHVYSATIGIRSFFDLSSLYLASSVLQLSHVCCSLPIRPFCRWKGILRPARSQEALKLRLY